MKSTRKPKHGAFAELIASAKMITFIVVIMAAVAAAVIGYITAFGDRTSQETSGPPQFSPVCEQSERRYGTEARIGDVGTAPRIIQIDGRNVTVPAGDWAELNRPVTEDFLGVDWNGSGRLEPDSTEFSHIYFLDPQDAPAGSSVDGLVIPSAAGSNIYNALHGTGRSFQKGWKIYRNLQHQCWGIDPGQTFTATTTTTTAPPPPVAAWKSGDDFSTFTSARVADDNKLKTGDPANDYYGALTCDLSGITFVASARGIRAEGQMPSASDSCLTKNSKQYVPYAVNTIVISGTDGSPQYYDVPLPCGTPAHHFC